MVHVGLMKVIPELDFDGTCRSDEVDLRIRLRWYM
jgi:hypothetical protein